MSKQEVLRRIPSVEKTVAALGGDTAGIPRPVAVAIVRNKLDAIRRSVAVDGAEPGSPDEIQRTVRDALARFAFTRIRPVINGTGVLIHTNLGRSPMGETVAERLGDVATSYCNIEIDLAAGERGPRAGFLETCLATLCQAEAATVVNNCAAALVLILKHLATGSKSEVVISRGELVEIGGGFRVPEIMEASGAKLREVGATNKTRVSDYEDAINESTGMLLKVHRSNFSMEGFVSSPSTEELAALSRKTGVPLVEDLGSGAMMRTDQLAPIEHEPTPWELINAGVDLVCFSGDKLLGGPQAGIIAGKRELVRGVKREPFYRAVRPDKLILTLLQETAAVYLDSSGSAAGGSGPEVPVLQMLGLEVDELEKRAESVLTLVSDQAREYLHVGSGIARCGGGTMPKAEIPSVTVDIQLDAKLIPVFASALRKGTPAVVGYTESDVFKLDLRTVFPRQDADLARRISEGIADTLGTSQATGANS